MPRVYAIRLGHIAQLEVSTQKEGCTALLAEDVVRRSGQRPKSVSIADFLRCKPHNVLGRPPFVPCVQWVRQSCTQCFLACQPGQVSLSKDITEVSVQRECIVGQVQYQWAISTT